MTEASTPRPTDATASGPGARSTSPTERGARDTGSTGGPAQAPSGSPARTDPLKDVRHTRVSALWVGVIAASLLLIALLVFILQNSQSVTVAFLGFDVSMPLAVALLLAAVAGVLLVAIPGAARIAQLRRAVRKNR